MPPTTSLSSFVYYKLLDDYLTKVIDSFQYGFVYRTMSLVGIVALLTVTIWIVVQGYRIVTGQSREPMMGFVISSLRVTLIVLSATTVGLAGSDINTFLTNDLGKAINYEVTGNEGSAADSIDKSLAYTQLALAAIDTVQTAPGDTETSEKKLHSMLLAGFGVASPPMTAGALLLFYKFIMAIFIGSGPLFIMCLIFDQTKDLFRKWIMTGIGTLFGLAFLNLVTSIMLNASLGIAEGLWSANFINNLTGSGTEGLSSQALAQGGMGLLLTILIFTVPRWAASFFGSSVGEFVAFSQFERPGGRGGLGPQGQMPGSYTPPTPPANYQPNANLQTGSSSPSNLNLGRMVGGNTPGAADAIRSARTRDIGT